MKLKFEKKYKFAHGGTRVEHFVAGQVVENPSPRLYEIARRDGAAIDPDKDEKAPANGSKTSKGSKVKA